MNASSKSELVLRVMRLKSEDASLSLSIKSATDRYKGLCLEDPNDPRLEQIRLELETYMQRLIDSIHAMCLLTREIQGK